MSNNLRVKKTRRIRKPGLSPTQLLNKKVVDKIIELPVPESVKKVLDSLPKPRFTRLSTPEEDKDDDEVGEVEFERPDHYIRYIEPTEKELFERVEYDMDEQDQVYLELINQGRRKAGLSNITPYIFECIIDRLEKEWYSLVKDLPNEVAFADESTAHVPSEDSACAICDDTEVENSNAIVFCDGCNLAVHQDCYGIPYIPEGQWLCRKCMISPDKPVSCIFCPNEGGAFKQTRNNQWGHLLCAIWIPEVGVSNTVYMEPIDRLEAIPKNRLKLSCYICKKKQGACIQCDSKYCFTAFHVTCARSVKLCMRMNHHENNISLKAYCDKHTPKDYEYNTLTLEENILKAKNTKKQKKKNMTVAETKAARAHQHQYSTGIPIAPDEILTRLDKLSPLKDIRTKQRAQIVNEVCHYWSLKREARRGAPLIKRLHLEPWTANSSQTVDQQNQLLAMKKLRFDLETLRNLTNQVKQREKEKLKRIRTQVQYLETIYFPMDGILLRCLDEFMALDKKNLFISNNDDEVNEYSLTAIYQNIISHVYKDMNEFKQAVTRIWEHVIHDPQHPVKSSIYRLAQRLKAAAPPLFEKAENEWKEMKLMPGTTSLNVPVHQAIFDYDTIPVAFPVEDWDRMEEEQKAKEEAKRLKHKKKEEARLAAERKREKEAARRKARKEAAEKKKADAAAAATALESQKTKQGSEEQKEGETTNTSTPHIDTINHNATTITTGSSSSSIIPAKRKARYGPPIKRTTRSQGLTSSVDELVQKEQKMSSEARQLYNSYYGACALSRKKPSYREDKNRQASVGWVYVKSDDEDEDKESDEEDEEIDIITDEPDPKRQKKSSKESDEITTSVHIEASITEESITVEKEDIRVEETITEESITVEKETPVLVEEMKEDAPVHIEDSTVQDKATSTDEKQEGYQKEEDNEKESPSKPKAPKKSAGRKVPKDYQPLKDTKPGDMVWSRLGKTPFHPAKVLDDEETPPHAPILKYLKKRYPERVPIEFLHVTEKQTWKRVDQENIFELGEPKLDEYMLMSLVGGKWGELDRRIGETMQAYKTACQAKGIDPTVVLRKIIDQDPRTENKLTEDIL